MGEDGDAVEWAVVLRVVQPALEAVRTLATDANADDVRRAAVTHSMSAYFPGEREALLCSYVYQRGDVGLVSGQA